MRTNMRQMVAGKLDPVEEFKRALRHAAHEYHIVSTVPAQARNDATGKDHAADTLYRAARALVAAELIRDTQEK